MSGFGRMAVEVVAIEWLWVWVGQSGCVACVG